MYVYGKFAVGADSVQLAATITMPTCDGGTDGAIALQAAGGVGPYQFSWADFPQESGTRVDNLSVGDYGVYSMFRESWSIAKSFCSEFKLWLELFCCKF